MKNFLRALKFCWAYRLRLGASVVCAILAAVFWGLNFTAVYPVLKMLGTDQNLQDWCDGKIDEVQWRIEGDPQKNVEGLQAKVDKLTQKYKQIDGWPDSSYKEKQLRDTSSNLVRAEGVLESARYELWRYQFVKRYLDMLPRDRFETLVWVLVMVIIAVLIKGIFEFAQETLVGSAVNLSLYDMRNRFYRRVLHQDVNSFGQQGTSELMARFTNDMEILGQGMKTLFGKVIAEPLRALACVVVACWISWQLTLMFLVLVPIAVFILNKIGRVLKRATRRQLERMGSIYKILQESLQGIRVVKAFTMEPYERRRFHTATRDYYNKVMQVVILDSATSPIIELMGVAAVALAFLAGAYLVLTKHTHLFGLRMTETPLDSESLLQLYLCLAAIADPVRKLSSVYTRLQSGAAAADRVFTIADRQPRITLNSDGPVLPRHHESIEFRDVCFSYSPERPTLTNINLTIRHGETVAIVGANGCGKSTLVGLLPRFYDVDHGTILIDGQDVRNVNLRSLRRQIAIVTQDAILFEDTIYNNIAYGNRRASREQIEEASRKSFAHDFILERGGYEIKLGESAASNAMISGGQKQRLALARAILRDPAILILDEFTSQYDAESEVNLHRALKDFMKNRTTIVITHRLNTLEVADRIVVLDGGRIAAVGTHQELLGTCPIYQRLHEAQFQRLCA